MNDVVWETENVSREAQVAVPAAKLHVLGLAPLKKVLGAKWERLSGLVHKLFEKAITRAQGPGDYFVVLDQLSYVMTFANLSFTEANLVCASIAKEVCEHLFGNQIDEISVRSIVAEVITPEKPQVADVGARIEAMVERSGTETVFTQSVQSGSREPVISMGPQAQRPPLLSMEQIEYAHSQLAQYGLRLALFPVWELQKGTANFLFCTPYSGNALGGAVCGRSCLEGISDAQIINVEIDVLNAAAAYAARVRTEKKICAIGVGVSYGSLCAFHSRIRYITALQKVRLAPGSTILLKIEQVPVGAPDGRVAELVAMLKLPNIRVTVEFQSLSSVQDFSVRLGATGLGGSIPLGLESSTMTMLAEKLVRHAVAQKAFAYLDRLDTAKLVNAAYQANVRFGMGTALGVRYFSGLESIPDFPLSFVQYG